jgi:curved DNA-binding protein CbpA
MANEAQTAEPVQVEGNAGGTEVKPGTGDKMQISSTGEAATAKNAADKLTVIQGNQGDHAAMENLAKGDVAADMPAPTAEDATVVQPQTGEPQTDPLAIEAPVVPQEVKPETVGQEPPQQQDNEQRDTEPAAESLSEESKPEAATDGYRSGAEGRNFYDILGVKPGATPEELKQAYKELAIKYHPNSTFTDHQPDDGERFKDVQEAYFVLSSATETANYRDGLGRYARTGYPDTRYAEPPQADTMTQESSETFSSDAYAPKPGESWTVFTERTRSTFFQDIPTDDPLRADYERFYEDVHKLLYEELARQFKDRAREGYQRRTGKQDFDEFYARRDGESREVYKVRVREQMQQDFPNERFDETFDMLVDEMFPEPVAPTVVITPQPEKPDAGLTQQLIDAVTEGPEGELTREQQEAKLGEPGFVVSIENDPQYREMLETKLKELQATLDQAIAAGQVYDQASIDREIVAAKRAVFAQYASDHPQDAAWYEQNTVKADRAQESTGLSAEDTLRKTVDQSNAV